MKRLLCCVVCIVLIFSFIGSNSDSNNSVLSGNYYAVGDYEEMLTPYLWLDTNENKFSLGAGSVVSYAENGSYEIVDGKIIATSQSARFEFEIQDKSTLVLTDNADNDFFKIPTNTQFVYSIDLK